jgi:hypothetical protein
VKFKNYVTPVIFYALSTSAFANTMQCPVEAVDCYHSVCIPSSAISGWNIGFEAGLKDGRYYFAGARAHKAPEANVHGNCLYTLNKTFPEPNQKDAVALSDGAYKLTPDTGPWIQSSAYLNEEDCPSTDLSSCKFKVHEIY